MGSSAKSLYSRTITRDSGFRKPSLSSVSINLARFQASSLKMSPSGIRPSPLGIALAALLVVGTIYYLTAGYTKSSSYVSMKELLVSSIEFAERGGVIVKQVSLLLYKSLFDLFPVYISYYVTFSSDA